MFKKIRSQLLCCLRSNGIVSNNVKLILMLRVVHGMFFIYFLTCMVYIFYATIFLRIDTLLVVAMVSLFLEGFVVFVLNNGDCPMIYIQRRIGDDKPFTGLFLPPKFAKQTLPMFAKVTGVGMVMLVVRVLVLGV